MFTVLLGILLAYIIVWLGTEIRLTLRETSKVGFENLAAPTITVNAEGEATAVPDVATVDLGVTNVASTAAGAQDANTQKMNGLISGLRELGLAETDVKTSVYSIHPRYDYDVSPAVVSGYEASQTLTVKIRDNDLVDQVLAKAGDLGATTIGSLYFEIDDDTAVAAEAREKAIARAYVQAQDIADAMDARLGPVVNYYESQDSDVPMYARYLADEAMNAGAAPDIQEGENEVSISVSITYALY